MWTQNANVGNIKRSLITMTSRLQVSGISAFTENNSADPRTY